MIVTALLLVMFIYAVIVTPPPGDADAEPPALEPPAPAAALPARRPLAPMSPACAAGLAGDAVCLARHTRAAAPLNQHRRAALWARRSGVAFLITDNVMRGARSRWTDVRQRYQRPLSFVRAKQLIRRVLPGRRLHTRIPRIIGTGNCV